MDEVEGCLSDIHTIASAEGSPDERRLSVEARIERFAGEFDAFEQERALHRVAPRKNRTGCLVSLLSGLIDLRTRSDGSARMIADDGIQHLRGILGGRAGRMAG
jgi:hypothetical protein